MVFRVEMPPPRQRAFLATTTLPNSVCGSYQDLGQTLTSFPILYYIQRIVSKGVFRILLHCFYRRWLQKPLILLCPLACNLYLFVLQWRALTFSTIKDGGY